MPRLSTDSPRLIYRLRIGTLLRGAFVVVPGLLPALLPALAQAAPEGGSVAHGSASVAQAGTVTTITQSSDRAVLDWQKFNVGAQESVGFVQPSANAIAVNRIHDINPSKIDGQLTANGQVVLVNQNGVLFGPNARVDVHGLIASTAAPTDKDASDWAAGLRKDLPLSQAGNPDGMVLNAGGITARDAGLVGFVAPQVVNSGVIVAKAGRVHLASGDTATLDMQGDGLVSVAVSDATTRQISANHGLIQADGGTVLLTAAAGASAVHGVINVDGIIQARTLENKNGRILLSAEGSNAVAGNVAADKGLKSGSSTVLVSGLLDASGRGAGQRGGSITVTGDNVALLKGAQLDASGNSGKAGTTAHAVTNAEKAAHRRTTGADGHLTNDGSAGGEVQVGGDYLGQGATPTAKNLYVDAGALILNDAIASGDAGRSIFWSDQDTSFNGNVYARALGGKTVDMVTWSATSGGALGDGGFVETSGHHHLDVGGYVDLTASNALSARGTYFLDPTDITIYGNVDPSFVSTDGAVNLASALKLWLDASDASKVNLTYSALGTTATGSLGGTTITVGSNSNLAVGARIRLGSAGSVTAASTLGADTYTITAISGTTVTLGSALTANYSGSSLYQGYASQLTDKSGQGNNATQTNAGIMPVWLSNAQNGLGVLKFDGIDDRIVSPLALSNPANIFAVFNVDAYNGYMSIYANNSANNYQLGASNSVDNVSNGQYYYSSTGIFNAGNNVPIGSNMGNGAYINFANWNGASSSYNVNGNAYSGSFSDSDTSFNGLTIGSRNGMDSFNGKIYDLIAYNSVLSAQARNVVEQYESAKWNIALTPPGSGATEATKAMASTARGDATDGYSVFTTRYLERLSQTADISLQASNNINLDLKGDTLAVAGGRNLTLTAGNNIASASAGTVTTSGTGSILLSAGNDININHALNFTASGTGSITERANENIVHSGGGVNTTNGGAITLNSDRDANGSGAIALSANSNLLSNGGAITLGGGAAPATTYAFGNASYRQGVQLLNASVDAHGGSGGTISMLGRGYGAGTLTSPIDQAGIFFNVGVATTDGTGTLTLKGIGGGTGSGVGAGIYIAGGNSWISAVNGDITLIGQGGGGATSSGNSGITFNNGENRILSSGSGNFIITGTGGQTAGSTNNTGVAFNNGIKTATGNLTITAIKGANSGSGGFHNQNASIFGGATASGTLTLITDGLTYNTAPTIQTTGDIVIRPYTASTSIGIGGGAGTLSLNDTLLSGLAFGNLWLGGYGNPGDVGYISNAGNLTINSTRSFAGNVNFLSAGNILSSGTGTVTTTGAGNILLAALGDINLTTAQNFTAAGTGSITERANGNILHSGGGVKTTNGGGIILNADRDANSTGTIALTNNSNLTSNDGAITLGGGATPLTGFAYSASASPTPTGSGLNSDFKGGISIDHATLNAGSGTLTLNGRGATGVSPAGIILSNAALLQTSSGALTLNGIGGSSGANANIHGMLISGSTVTTATGAIALNGTGGSGTGGSNHGIILYNGGTVGSTGIGSITLTGIAGTGGANNRGISLSTGTNTIGGASDTGTIMLIADSLSATPAPVIQTTGDIVIRPYTASTSIGIGGGAGTLSLNDTLLSGLAFGNLWLGGYGNPGDVGYISNAGNLTINSTRSFAGNVNFLSAGNILSSGTGTVTTTGAGNILLAALGDINLTTAQNFTAAGTGSITERANGSIFHTGGAVLTTNGGALTMNADRDADNSGAVRLSGSSNLVSNGGNIVIGGGAAPGTGSVWGTSASFITTVNGGTSYGGGFILDSSTVNAGAGAITINAHGLNAGSISSSGVLINGATAKLQTTSGAITVNGTGGTATGNNFGMLISNGASVLSTTGNIALTAAGGSGSNGGNVGLYAYNGSTVGAAGSGNVTITGFGGTGGSINFGLFYNVGTNTIGGASETGTLTLLADSMSISTSPVFTTTGDLIMRPYTAGTTVGVGGAGTLSISDLALANITAANIWLGGYGNPGDVGYISNAGNMTISLTRSFAKNINFLSAGNILSSGTGTVTTTSAGNILLAALGDINLSTAQNFTAAGTGSITQRANENIIQSGGGVNTTNGGGITLNSDRDANGSGAIRLGTGSNLTSNGGAITLGGGATPLTVAATGNSILSQGISLTGLTINSGAGAISLRGQGNYGGTQTALALAQHGIYMNGATVQGTGAGAVYLNGGGGGNAGTGHGVVLTGGSSVIGKDGNISVFGLGGGGSATSNNYGILFDSTGTNKVESTGSGYIFVQGTGSNNASDYNHGIVLNSAAGGILGSSSGMFIAGVTPTGANSVGIINNAGGAGTIGGATATGNIGINTDKISLASVPTIQTTGNVLFRSYGSSIGIAGAAGGTQLTTAILNAITAGSIAIGDATDTTTITANAYSWAAPVSLLTKSANIVLNGLQTLASGKNFIATTNTGGNITLGSSGGVTTSGTGTIALNAANQITTSGAGSLTSGAGNIGLTATNGIALSHSTPITSTSGNITFNSPLTSTASQVFNSGTGIITTGTMAVGANDLNLTADDVVLGGNISGTGILTLQPTSTSRTIRLNSAGAGFSLSTTELGYLTDGWSQIILGRSGNNGGSFAVGAVTFKDPTTFNLYGQFFANAAITGTGNASFTIASPGFSAINLGTTGAITTAGGSVTTSSGAQLLITTNGTKTITTNGGNLSIGNLGVSTAYAASPALTLNSGGGSVTISTLTSDATDNSAYNATINAGAGAVTFGSTVDSNFNLTATGGSFAFNGAWGSTSALGNVSLTSTGSFALPVINAANLYLSTSGTVTQTGAIIAPNLLLAGTGGIYNLTNSGNAIGTLAANTGTVNFLENSGFTIGSVNGTNGLTASNAYLSSTGNVGQTQAIVTPNLLLGGGTGNYYLNDTGNAITSLAINADTVQFLENSGFNIGTINGVNGISTVTKTTLTSTGAVTQSQAIATPYLVLLGTGGSHTLTDAGNNVNALAANTGSLNLVNGNHNLYVTGIGSTYGITATGNVTLNAGTGTITSFEPMAVGAGNLTLTAGDLALGAALTGTGLLTLAPSGNQTVGLGNASTGAFNLNDTELGYLTDGWSGIVIGSATDTGAMDLRTAVAWKDPVTFLSGTGMIGVNAAQGGSGNSSFTFSGPTTFNANLVSNSNDITLNGATIVAGGGTRAINAGTGLLAINGTLSGIGQNTTLTSGDIAINNNISSNGGGVLTLNQSGNRTIGVAGAVGTYNLSAAELNRISNWYFLTIGGLGNSMATTINAYDWGMLGVNFKTGNGGITVAGAQTSSVYLSFQSNVTGTIALNGTITADSVGLSTNGMANQTAAITVNSLGANGGAGGNGGTYNLTNSGNNIGTVAANAVAFNLNNGNNNLTVGTANGINGITTTGNTTLDAGTGTITTTQAIATGAGNLTFSAGDVNFNGLIGGTGILSLLQASQDIKINSGSGGFYLSTTDINNLQDGWTLINVGSGAGGNAWGLDVGASTWKDPVNFSSNVGWSTTFSGTLTGTGNASFTSNSTTTILKNSTITTAGGKVDFSNAGYVYSNYYGATNVINSNGGNISLPRIQLARGLTLNAGTGNIAFNSTIDGVGGLGAFDMTASGNGFTFGGAWGNTTPIGNVSLTSANTSFTLPNLASTGNVALNAGTGTITTGSIATGAGDLTLTADDLAIGGNLSGTGVLTLQASSASRLIRINRTGSSSLSISTTELGYLSDGWSQINIGRSSGNIAGSIDIGAATFKDPVVFNHIGTIALNGALVGTGNASFTFDAPYASTTNFKTGGSITTAGGGVTVSAGSPLQVLNNGSYTVSTNGGAINIGGLGNYNPGGVTNLTLNSGSGNILISSVANVTGNSNQTLTLASSGIVNFGSTIDSNFNLTANAGSFAFNGDWGGTNALGNVSLTSANTSFTLPNLASTGNVALNAGTGTITTGSIATGAGDLTLTADDLAIGGNLSGTGVLTLQASSASRLIRINRTGSSSLSISTTELGYLSDGWSQINIGRSSGNIAGNIDIGAATFKDPVNFNIIGVSSIRDALVGTGNASFNFNGLFGTTNFYTGSSITTSGGAVTMSSGAGLQLQNTGTYNISTSGGAINLAGGINFAYPSGTQALNLTSSNGVITVATIASVGDNSGLTLTTSSGNAATNFTGTVGGNFNLTGSANTFTFNGDWGGTNALGNVSLTSANTSFTLPNLVSTGNVALNAGTGTITTGSIATGAGNLTLTADDVAIGGNLSGTGALKIQGVTFGRSILLNYGSGGLNLSSTELGYMNNGWNSLTFGSSPNNSTFENISIGAYTSSIPIVLGGYNHVLYGNLNLTGTAGLSLAANGNGLNLQSGVNLTTAGGSVDLSNGGVYFDGLSSITTNGGNVTLGSISIRSNGSINSGNGNINVLGSVYSCCGHDSTGETLTLNAGGGAIAFGSTADTKANIIASGGTLTFNGAWGGTTPLGNVSLTSANTSFTMSNLTSTGNVSLNAGTGTITTGSIATGAGNLTLTSDDVVIGNTLSGTGTLTLQPYSTSRLMRVNFYSGDYNLDSTELGRLQDGWGLIQIGRSDLTNAINLGATSWTDPVKFRKGTYVYGLVAGTDNASITFDGSAELITAGNNITTTGTAVTVTDYLITNGNAGIGAWTIATGGGALTLGSIGGNNSSGKTLTLNAGAGALTFGGAVEGAENLTANAGSITFGGAWGGTTPLGAVSLTSASALTLPSITAASILARSTGAASDLTLASGKVLTASGSGNAITLAAGRNFINNAGAGALSLTGGGRWLIYSASPGANTLGGLTQGFNRYSCAYTVGGGCVSVSVAVPASGNGLLYSYTPTLTATPTAQSVIYGDAATLSGYGYALSGYNSGDTDSVTGSLTGTSGYAPGSDVGSYGITYASGALSSALGYGFTYANNATAITVGQRTLTASLTGVVSKIYDGTTAATLASGNYNLANFYGSDASTVLLNNPVSGSYDTRNVGTGKTVSVSGLSIGGAKSGNYVLASTGVSGAVGTILAKTLTAALTGTVSKTYDTNNIATLATGNYTLSGIVGSDAVDITRPASGTYDTIHAGTGKTVSVSGLALTGVDLGNYSLAATSLSGNIGTILAKTLTAALTGTVSKTYDTTDAATLAAGNYTLSNALGSDVVTLNNPTGGTYDTIHAGTGKTVSVSGLSLTGANASDYTLASNAVSGNIGTILAKTLTAALTGTVNKTYDTTDAATLAAGNYTLSNALGSDVVTLNNPTDGTYDTIHAGTGKTVSVSGLSLTGANASDYTLASNAVSGNIGTILAKTLTAALTGTVNKTYDTTDAATLAAGNYTLSNALGSDVVTLNNPTDGTYDTIHAGTGKTVSVSGLALTGANAADYALSATSLSGSIGTILAKTLTAALTGTVSRIYNGTDVANLTAGNFTLSSALGSDAVTLNSPNSGTYDNKNIGSGKIVTAAGLVLAGTNAADYTLASGSVQGGIGTILAKSLTPSLAGSVSKTYNGTTNATLSGSNYTLSGVVGAEDVSLNDPAIGSYNSKSAGTGKTVSVSGLALTGADAGNYTLSTSSLSGNIGTILAKSLAILGVGVMDKTYDGTTNATIDAANATFSGRENGDVVNLNAGTLTANFLDAHAGNAKAVDISGFSLMGADAVNYVLDTNSFTASAANILKRGTMAVWNGTLGRTYGEANPAVTSNGHFTYDNLVAGDTNAAILANADFSGLNTEANVGSYALGALFSSNDYLVTNAPSTLFTITPRALNVATQSIGKTYGEADPIFSGTSTGLTAHDANLIGWTFAPQAYTGHAGSYAIVATASDAQNRLANYIRNDANGSFSVSKAPLNIRADDKTRLVGEPNPSFTASYAGFRNGDNASILSDLRYEAPGNATSAGMYAITPYGAIVNDYIITYQAGTLVINNGASQPGPIIAVNKGLPTTVEQGRMSAQITQQITQKQATNVFQEFVLPFYITDPDAASVVPIGASRQASPFSAANTQVITSDNLLPSLDPSGSSSAGSIALEDSIAKEERSNVRNARLSQNYILRFTPELQKILGN